MKKMILAAFFPMLLLHATQAQDAKQFYEQGLEQAQAGKFEEAIKLFGKSIELQPKDHYAWYNRGIAYSLLEQYEDALPDFDQTVKLAPDYPKGYLNRGIARRHLTIYEGALADYSSAIRLDSSYAEAYYNRGMLYDLLSKRDPACADFNKAKQLGLKPALKKVEKCNNISQATMAIYPILRLTKTAKTDQYGFTPEKPVKVGTGPDGGPANQRAYFDLLRDAKGKPVKYKRIGSCCDYKSENGFMGYAKLDKYEITYLNRKGEETKATVYLSFYDYEEPQILSGFKTVGQK